ncbi:MAG: formylglycine-generating enzyme family protein [Polyangiaceae bacterium]
MKITILSAAIVSMIGAIAVGCSQSGAAVGQGSGSGSGVPPQSGPGGLPPSCAPGGPGMTNCGASGTESCCASLDVAGGTYDRTYHFIGDAGAPTGLADPATVSDFRLDRYEVTVGRFRSYVNYLNAGGSPPVAGSGKHAYLNGGNGLANSASAATFETGWDSSWSANLAPGGWNEAIGSAAISTWTPTAGANENLPIVPVNWYDAYAFCIWDGGFLPSDAEWGYAAAGGDQERKYPWGSADPGTNNQYAIYGCYYPSGTFNCALRGVLNIAPVGRTTLGAGLWGQMDLAGNAPEWVLDTYNASLVDPCMDCTYLAPTSDTSNRVDRGSNWVRRADSLVSNRSGGLALGGYGYGIRCARPPLASSSPDAGDQ